MRLALLASLLMTAALPALAGILPDPVVTVPEPATMAVLAAGVGALLMARRRRK